MSEHLQWKSRFSQPGVTSVVILLIVCFGVIAAIRTENQRYEAVINQAMERSRYDYQSRVNAANRVAREAKALEVQKAYLVKKASEEKDAEDRREALRKQLDETMSPLTEDILAPLGNTGSKQKSP